MLPRSISNQSLLNSDSRAMLAGLVCEVGSERHLNFCWGSTDDFSGVNRMRWGRRPLEIVMWDEFSYETHNYLTVNSLVPVKCGSKFKCITFESNLWLEISSYYCEISFMRMPWVLTDDKSTLVQAMDWYRQANVEPDLFRHVVSPSHNDLTCLVSTGSKLEHDCHISRLFINGDSGDCQNCFESFIH